ncbi:MAG TPA: phosphoribosylformylglycinamidine synthase subunit PurQ [Ktedonobacterales bacterium]|jgi:phosphoribosylformylglycinamidine synthase subunit PurQ / glutaminase|nr:phosphoribosylformylglycinamidine synthase subunit PurQ [Ktedonobacterales bacterium]
MKFGVVVFPGTWSDKDCLHILGPVMGHEAVSIWHEDTDLQGCDAIVLPGGFSYGDYLRAGAIARFAPVMGAIQSFAERGGLVLGICNGFQILLEAGMLPGAMQRNASLEFRCEWTHLRVENAATPFTRLCERGQVLRIPISHGEGNYFADDETLDALEASGGVLVRYCAPDGSVTPEANPNGSRRNIAGIVSPSRNVAAMMPHPERCGEAALGGEDGRLIFASMVAALTERRAALSGTSA